MRLSANRRWSTFLGWGAVTYPRTHVQTVKADSCLFIPVLHRPLILLLHGCEPVHAVTLRYCCFQEDKTDEVLVTLHWGVCMLILAGSQFSEAHSKWRYCMETGNPSGRNFVIFPIGSSAILLDWLNTEKNIYFVWKPVKVCSLRQLLSFITEAAFFWRHELKLNNELNIADCRKRRLTCLPSLRYIAPNHIAYGVLFAIDCKSAYYVENLTMFGGAVCRQRPELWKIFCHMELCVSRDLKCVWYLVTWSCV